MGRDVFEVGAWVDPVELARPDQTVLRGSSFAPAIGAGEQEVLATQTHAAQCVFGQGVADLGIALFAVQHERVSLVERVTDRFGQFGFLRQCGELVRHPRLDGREQQHAFLLPFTSPFTSWFATDVDLDAVEFADPFEHLSGRLGRRAVVDFVDVPSGVVPACSFMDLAAPVQFVEAAVAAQRVGTGPLISG